MDFARRSLLLASVILFGACTGEVGPSSDNPDAGTVVCPEESLLSWENFGDPFMRNWCTGCHSTELPEALRRNAPEKVNFDSLEGVRQLQGKIMLLAANNNKMMPPAGGPGTPERELLGEWIACGTPTQEDLDW